MPLLDALLYGVRDVLDSANNLLPRRSRIRFLNGTVEDNQANDTIDVTPAGGGGGGAPGGSQGQVQLHDASDEFAGSPAFEIDPDRLTSFAFRGVLRYPGTRPSSEYKPIGLGGPTSFTDLAYGATHCLPFVFDTYAAASTAAIDCLAGKHTGLIQIVAQGVCASGVTRRILVIPYTCDVDGVISLGTTIDQTPAALVSADPTLVLAVAGANATGDGIPYIELSDGGDGAERVRWSGQIQLTMTVDP